MTIVPIASDVPVQRYARAAGVLLLLSIVGGFFGELYLPSKLIVAGDAAATASNLTTLDSLYRLGFAGYLLEAVCDVSLTLVFYVLLRPVNRELALATVLFGIISTTLFAMGEAFYFAPPLLLSGADYLTVFTAEQLNAFALLAVKMYGRVSGIFMLFYGVATLLRGYLILRSDFLPSLLGVLMIIAGSAFVVRNFVFVLAPAYASDLFLAPMFLAAVSLTGWFLVKGVDVPKWRAMAASGRHLAD
jgi:hypothetical protein